MSPASINATSKDISLIKAIVDKYKKDRELIETALNQLKSVIEGSRDLMGHVHSLRWRMKEPTHLKDKLSRKLKKARAKSLPFDITIENYLEKINDLAGIRILHLHAAQIVDIDVQLKKIFSEYRYEIIEDAKARTWDDEYRAFYKDVGINTVDSPKMYTSVHYVVSPSFTTKVTCEIQVRTLAEELWGEVDHSMNYPHDSKIKACRDQIKVLARMTSSCSRLVDSIYETAKAQTGSKSAKVGSAKKSSR
jgi:putative GTP pyrophosphokinase